MIREPAIKKQADMLRAFFAETGVKLTNRQALDRVAMLKGYPSWQVMEKLTRNNNDPVEPKKAKRGTYDATREIAIIWRVEDVQALRPDLSESQCLEVLHLVKNRHDAEQGVNWYVISELAEELFAVWHIQAEYREKGTDNWDVVTVVLSNGTVLPVAKEVYLASDDSTDYPILIGNGQLRFAELPDEFFDVKFSMCDGEPAELVRVVEALRKAGAVYDGRTRPKATWDYEIKGI